MEKFVVFCCSTKAYDYRFLVKLFHTELTCLYCICKFTGSHKKTAFVAEICCFETGCCLEFFVFETEPFWRETAFVIHRVFFFLRLNAVATSVRWKDHEGNLCLGEEFLAGNKFREGEDSCVISVLFSVVKRLLMSGIDFFYSFVGTFVASVSFEFIFQNHPGNADCLEKSFVVTTLSIPGRVEVSDQNCKFALLTGIIVVIKRLHESFIEFLRQFFAKDLRSKLLPQKSKCCIWDAIFTDPAVFLVVIIFSSADIKNNPVEVIRHAVAA